MWMLVFMLPVLIGQFYHERNSILAMRNSLNENVVNNNAYMFLYFIPYLFLFKDKKLISFVFAAVVMFFIMQGAKRGALVAGILGMSIFLYYQIFIDGRKKGLLNYLISILAILFLLYFSVTYYQSNEYLVDRMGAINDGGFSGRDLIYANIFNSWYSSSSIFNLVFGYGFGAALILSGTGNWAHNDWLESLACLGLVGVVLYGLLFLFLFRTVTNKALSVGVRMALTSLVVIWFVTTLVSMNYYNATNSVFQNVLLGFILGSIKASGKAVIAKGRIL